jgi:dCTP deaminase
MAETEGMIEPFEAGQVRELSTCDKCDRPFVMDQPIKGCPCGAIYQNPPYGRRIISYGTSSYGYDCRVAEEFKVFTPTHSAVVDPKALDERTFVDVTKDVKKQGYCLVPPNSFALCRSVERFKIPTNVLCIVLGKSSYARCGIVVNVTPLEPGWEGYVTIEISNTTPLPAKIYANEGIAQVLFYESDLQCETSYADRDGKYQGQEARIYLPKV